MEDQGGEGPGKNNKKRMLNINILPKRNAPFLSRYII